MNRRDFLTLALALPALRPGAWGRALGGPVLDPARLGASTACLAGYSLLDAIREIRRMGFCTIEIIAYTGARHSVGDIPGFALQEASPEERDRVYEATRAFRHISAHMPFQGIELLSSRAGIREAGLRRVREAIDGLAFLEGELAVVHAGWPERGSSYRDIWPRMLDTFRALGDYAGSRGIRIGLETMQPDSVEEYAGLIFDIDHPMVGATIDTGHIRGSRDIGLPPERRDSEEARRRFNDVLERTVEVLGEKVLHFHLSDVRRSDWKDHVAIGTGIVDFPRLFGLLREKRYEGLLVFELEEAEQVSALAASKALVAGLMTS